MRPLLFAALCCLPGCLLPSGGGTDTIADESESSTGETTGTPTTTTPDNDTSTGPDDTSTSVDPSTGPDGSCGDGMLSGDEECDNGASNADDAACLTTCKSNICGDGKQWADMEACDDGNDADDDACIQCVAATCGDNHIQDGVEVCDDGVNDGSYGGCSADCSAKGPFCGDGAVDMDNEECDDPNQAGCLTSCKLARSCLLLLEADDTLTDGMQTIYPTTPDMPVDVYCDMTTDEGGYTFLKVDVDSDLNDLPYPATKAEMECAKVGMQLWIPRSPAHLMSGYTVATTENLQPIGGGTKLASADYMQILGIYPETENMSCAGMPLTDLDCPEWVASDDEDWYVSDVSKSMVEPDPDLSCADCSMIYTWNLDGTVKTYKTVPSGGTSLRFFCDIGDKLP
jgi:hypothetical protein